MVGGVDTVCPRSERSERDGEALYGECSCRSVLVSRHRSVYLLVPEASMPPIVHDTDSRVGPWLCGEA